MGESACNSSASSGPFATGEVLTYSAVGCQGGFSVFLDTAAQTITFTTASAPFADYRFSEFTVTGITELTITSLSVVQLAPLFNTDSNPAPLPQLSFTGDSIRIFFGEKSGSAPIFDFSTNGGQAIFAYNDGGGVVPEPSTWAMMILGFGAAGSVLRQRRRPEAA
ncbi:MAG: PEPxxWA-CTERM sorting domain-containing protein [Phenylobacterium sp.]|nr:PEPxxWA-CTERM sorting domain-containing protein [Phenylobacterium sp.]